MKTSADSIIMIKMEIMSHTPSIILSQKYTLGFKINVSIAKISNGTYNAKSLVVQVAPLEVDCYIHEKCYKTNKSHVC